MKHTLHTFVILLFVLTIGGCASGRKALQKGDYSKAVAQAIHRLRANDDHKKARNTLSKAYRYAMDVYLANIEQAKQTNDILKWEEVAQNYEQINFMYDEILKCPACREIVPNPVRYDAQLASANQYAASARYDLGVEAMKQKRVRAKAIAAHQHFLRVQDFVPRYKDIEDKLAESHYYATLKVVVEPIPRPYRLVDVSHEFFVNKIDEHLHNYQVDPYVRFYTPDEADAEELEWVDHVIKMEFDRFSLGNVFMGKDSREVTKDSVLLTDDKERPVYGTVKATVTTHTKSITGGGLLDFKIYDNDLNKIISQEKFPSNYTWSIQWATFNGDERALSGEDKALVNKVELPVPNPQWMFEEFTAPLYDQVIGKIRTFYKGY